MSSGRLGSLFSKGSFDERKTYFAFAAIAALRAAWLHDDTRPTTDDGELRL